MKERSTSSMGLFRFYYVAGTSPLFVSTMIFREEYYHKHPEKYSKEQRFKFAKKIMLHMKNRGRVKTDYYGRENLPKEGGYILYSNHQGKYDAIGILTDQKEPCSVLMERKQGGRVVAKQVLRLTGSETLDLDNPKSQIATLKKVAEQVAEGRRYLIFPEGKWGDNKNTLQLKYIYKIININFILRYHFNFFNQVIYLIRIYIFYKPYRCFFYSVKIF